MHVLPVPPDVLPGATPHIGSRVITSYSIQYTKLYDALKRVKTEAADKFAANITDETKPLFGKLFDKIEKDILRKSVIEKNLRCDGRDPVTIRSITRNNFV